MKVFAPYSIAMFSTPHEIVKEW